MADEEKGFVEIEGEKFKEDPENLGEPLKGTDDKSIPFEGEPKEGEPSTPKEGEEGKKEEPTVPLSRLRDEAKKRKEAEEALQKTQKPEVPEDEKKVRETISKIEAEKKEQEKVENKQLEKELDDLEDIHGTFDRQKLLKVVDYYGCYDEEDNVKWDKAMELYNTPGILEKVTGSKSSPAQKKTPSSQRTGDIPRKEPYKTEGKSLWQIAEEAKKEIPE